MIFESIAPFRGVKVRAEVGWDDSRVEDVRRSDLLALPRKGDGGCVRCEARRSSRRSPSHVRGPGMGPLRDPAV